MKTIHALFLCSSVLVSGLAEAGKPTTTTARPKVVVASVQVDGVTHTAKLKLDAKGRIVPWSATKWASLPRSKGDSPFYWLGEHREESGIEYEHAGKAKNGFGIVTVGTTADAVTVGVRLKDGKGFLKYADHGSGNGNSQLSLTVTPAQ